MSYFLNELPEPDEQILIHCSGCGNTWSECRCPLPYHADHELAANEPDDSAADAPGDKPTDGSDGLPWLWLDMGGEG